MDDDALFLAVLDGGSFRSAAKVAGLDPSRVSRRIASLEDRIGVKLLNRTTRATAATEAGSRYAEGIRRLAASRAALLAEVTGGQDVPKGRLRVAAPVDFGARYVAPVLSRMSADYPELHVDLRLGSGFADLLAEGVDVAIRIGQLADSNLIARRIGVSRRVLVGSPDLAASVKTPADLERLQALSYRHGLTDFRAQFTWHGEDYDIRIPCRMGVNSMTAIRLMALEGRGVHLGPEWAFADDILEGRLRNVLQDAEFKGFPISAVWSPTPYQPAASRMFVANITEALKGLSMV